MKAKIIINRIDTDTRRVTLTDKETNIIYTASFYNDGVGLSFRSAYPHLVDNVGKLVANCPKIVRAEEWDNLMQKLTYEQRVFLNHLLAEIDR